MKILLIESDSAFAQEISAALEARGLEVRGSADGKEALELARAEHPAVIVLCVELPKMSGYSVCNKLKKDEQLKSIPLVIMSAEATAETFEQHRKLKTRAEGYLIKPFAPAALIDLLGTLVTLPAEAPVVSSDDIVTLDGIELQPSEPEVQVTADLGGARPAASEDDDLKLLDEAFEGLAVEEGVAVRTEPEMPSVAAPTVAEESGTDIDRIGAEADAALAALRLEEPVEADLASAAGLLDEEPSPAAGEEKGESLPAPPPVASEALLEQGGSLGVEGHEVRDALERRTAEVAELKERLSDALGQLATHRSDAAENEAILRSAREEDLRTAKENAAAAEALASSEQERASREEEGRRKAEALAEAAEARARAAEERFRVAEDRVRNAEERQRAAEETAKAAEIRAREAIAAAAEEKGRIQAADRRAAEAEGQLMAAVRRAEEGEARASAAAQEGAALKQRLDESEQAYSLKAAEAEQARERAEALARELDTAQARATAQEVELSNLRAELEKSRGELTSLRSDSEGTRAEAERLSADLRRRVSELEAQNAKHEERVVKAYQKIKGDEKIREKTRKALGIALQLLEERAAGATPSEVQPRRE
ncbi:MAG TPA: response regulator [Anaeromyxobacteraceae bacterium]|nr:response regulator [Anaeromyxobacteraceae bacterium]